MPSLNDCKNLNASRHNLCNTTALQDNLTKQLQKSTVNTAYHRSKEGLRFSVSCQASDVRIGCEDKPFCELQYRDRLFTDPLRNPLALPVPMTYSFYSRASIVIRVGGVLFSLYHLTFNSPIIDHAWRVQGHS